MDRNLKGYLRVTVEDGNFGRLLEDPETIKNLTLVVCHKIDFQACFWHVWAYKSLDIFDIFNL
jgi:hypothetical protein